MIYGNTLKWWISHTTQEASYCFPSLGLPKCTEKLREIIVINTCKIIRASIWHFSTDKTCKSQISCLPMPCLWPVLNSWHLLFTCNYIHEKGVNFYIFLYQLYSEDFLSNWILHCQWSEVLHYSCVQSYSKLKMNLALWVMIFRI